MTPGSSEKLLKRTEGDQQIKKRIPHPIALLGNVP